MVRPRGWHLPEKHVLVDGKPVPGAIFDVALYFFHNARELLKRGSGPYFYLPKMQSHLEARLWNAVFLDAQALLGIARGTIKVRLSYGTCTFLSMSFASGSSLIRNLAWLQFVCKRLTLYKLHLFQHPHERSAVRFTQLV